MSNRELFAAHLILTPIIIGITCQMLYVGYPYPVALILFNIFYVLLAFGYYQLREPRGLTKREKKKIYRDVFNKARKKR